MNRLEEPAIKFVPQEFLHQTFKCGHCGHEVQPDWLADRGRSMGSVEGRGGFWVRISAEENCSRCSSKVVIPIPVRERKAVVPMFGDEAIRPLATGNGVLYTYSLVGTSQAFLPEIEQQIKALKQKLNPELDPDAWSIHMTKIWSGQQRKKFPEFQHWTRAHIYKLLGGIGAILKSQEHKIFKYNILLAGQPSQGMTAKQFEQYVQQEAYMLLVMRVISAITDLGGQPVFTFDAQKPVKANHAIHQWANNSFRNGQGNLLYSFLSHSIHIPEPIFVRPASHPFLEVADIVSFAVARHHFCIARQKKPDINLSIFGKINYQTFSANGEKLMYQNCIGYPWRINYPIANKR